LDPRDAHGALKSEAPNDLPRGPFRVSRPNLTDADSHGGSAIQIPPHLRVHGTSANRAQPTRPQEPLGPTAPQVRDFLVEDRLISPVGDHLTGSLAEPKATILTRPSSCWQVCGL